MSPIKENKMEAADRQRMQEAVGRIRETMAEAAIRSGRQPEEVFLCAACKTRTVEEVRFSAGLPIDFFGENHVQELVEKTDANAYEGKPGHFIGHLQTNKIKKVLGRAELIHSVGSEHLAMAIEKEAARYAQTHADFIQKILLEVNIGKEESKGGVMEEELWPLMEKILKEGEHLRIAGLMAIPPVVTDEKTARGYLSSMKDLFEEAKERYEIQLPYLSMGMSGDYVWAIEEGANIVRIGTGIYGPRDYSKKN